MDLGVFLGEEKVIADPFVFLSLVLAYKNG